MLRIVLGLVLIPIMLAACSEPIDQQEAAFNDGYAFGYSRDCEATLVEVDTALLEDADYASEFARGRREGEAVCTMLRATYPGGRRPQ